jgi:hypothetical protein
VRNYFESPSFTNEFGGLTWPDKCGWEFSFVQEMQFNRKEHLAGQLTTTTRRMETLSLRYHFFDSTFNVFVFLFPAGEKNTSRIKILPAHSLGEAPFVAT